MSFIYDVAIVLLAYLLGSIPFGLIVAHLAGIGDITTQGSGNIGATNVVRVAGKKLGAIVFFLDGCKAIFAIALAKFCMIDSTSALIYIVAFAAIIGHSYSVMLRFSGGKGVATSLFAILFLMPIIGLLTLSVWLVIFKITKTSSKASLLAIISADIATDVLDYSDYAQIFMMAVMVLIFWRHRENIKRIMAGTEPVFTK